MISITDKSAWTFDTSATGGIGVEFVALQGGAIWLKDPAQASVRLRMVAVGAGLTYGLKLPKLGKLPPLKLGGKQVGGALGPKFFPSAGMIWKTAACSRQELVHDDFCGPVVFIEGGGALVAVAGAVDLMLLGFDKLAYAESVASAGMLPGLESLLMDRALSTVKAVMLCGGVSATYGASVGVALMTGAIW
ncbi:MAG: hypothetical protein ACRYG8_19570 [Janthinobacterium lividum]